MTALRLLLLAAALTGGLGGCSWFGGDDEDEVGPAPLLEFEPEAEVEVLWTQRVGAGLGERYTLLRPAIVGDVIYAADAYGLVEARTRDSGERVWQARIGAGSSGVMSAIPFVGRDDDDGSFLTGGVAADEFTVFVGTTTALIVALRASDGGELWRAQLSSEILAPVAMDTDRVYVASADGRLTALSRSDGSRIWSYDTQVPVLSLRGDSSPVMGGPLVIKGFANGKLSALRGTDGQLLWEHRVTLPSGRSELDRMADIDSDPLVTPAAVYVAGYQGSVKALRFNDGTPQWEQAISTHSRMAEGYSQLYITDDLDHLHALDQGSGALVWEQPGLDRRVATGPAVAGAYLVVGDDEGFLHVFGQTDGRPIARRRIDGEGIRVTPLVNGETFYVLGNSGRLSAVQVRRLQ